MSVVVPYRQAGRTNGLAGLSVLESGFGGAHMSDLFATNITRHLFLSLFQ